MPDKGSFLCEIGTEEIPAGYFSPAIAAIRRIVAEEFARERLAFDRMEIYATPRRLALIVHELALRQKEEELELKGPSIKAAYDDKGTPTKALQGFMKGNGLTEKEISTRKTDKGEYIYAVKRTGSRPADEILPGIITRLIEKIPFPKKMKWGDKELLFPRPITYFILLLNGQILPLEIAGISSSDKTRGHFIQHNSMIPVPSPGALQEILRKNGVILDQEERLESIRRGLEEAAKKAGGRLREDNDLLDTVTYLVEYPYIVTCTFAAEFLEIPDIVLIAEMREHQKYFSVVDKEWKLTDRFLVVSNNPSTDYIRAGNERVISARFNDARFFYDEDRKLKLADRVDSLKKVLFHRELGSVHDKMLRMKGIASVIADTLGLDKEETKSIERAVTLSKADLVTAMVNEFPSLQGRMGKIYALSDGEDEKVAAAIEEHYRPRFHGDPPPEGVVSIVVSLAEKIDNIFGSFSVGNIPKGARDPYALRRQANAIVETALSSKISLPLEEVLSRVSESYTDGAACVSLMLDFISARVKTIFGDHGLRHDEIDACLSIGISDYYELFRRAESVHSFRENDQFSDMLLGFKRMNNILTAFRKKEPEYALTFKSDLIDTDEERELFGFFESRKDAIQEAIKKGAYIDLFTMLIEGKGIIDNFFDTVLVMEKETSLRDNRLGLLEGILSNFTGLIDFSRIEEK